MKNLKLQALFAEARALIQAEVPEDRTPGFHTWLIAALTNLDSSESFYESYEAAVEREKGAAQHAQNIAKIQQESAEEVKRHNADMAARAEQRAQGATRPSKRDRT